jgi:hypothetical protein
MAVATGAPVYNLAYACHGIRLSKASPVPAAERSASIELLSLAADRSTSKTPDQSRLRLLRVYEACMRPKQFFFAAFRGIMEIGTSSGLRALAKAVPASLDRRAAHLKAVEQGAIKWLTQ